MCKRKERPHGGEEYFTAKSVILCITAVYDSRSSIIGERRTGGRRDQFFTSFMALGAGITGVRPSGRPARVGTLFSTLYIVDL